MLVEPGKRQARTRYRLIAALRLVTTWWMYMKTCVLDISKNVLTRHQRLVGPLAVLMVVFPLSASVSAAPSADKKVGPAQAASANLAVSHTLSGHGGVKVGSGKKAVRFKLPARVTQGNPELAQEWTVEVPATQAELVAKRKKIAKNKKFLRTGKSPKQTKQQEKRAIERGQPLTPEHPFIDLGPDGRAPVQAKAK